MGDQSTRNIVSGSRNKEDYLNFLEESADKINVDRAITIYGNGIQDSNALEFGKGSNHEASVSSIDKEARTVTYENPWNPKEPVTISWNELAEEMAKGAGDGFDYVDV